MAPSAAPALKDGFDTRTVAWIADRVAAAAPGFDRARFAALATHGFEPLTLMARVRHVAAGLAATLTAPFPDALAVVEAALGAPPPRLVEGEGIAAFRGAPFLDWVALAGGDAPDVALPALARLTRHFTAEYAVRPFLDAHPDMTFGHVAAWVADPDPRVRRLASEGTRPLLPWGRHIAHLKRAPERALALIATLATDPSDSVPRSAATHPNDVSRLAPDLALAHAARWAAAPGEAAAATVRHALRTLVKAGHPEALRLLGYDVHGVVAVRQPRLDATTVPIGGALVLEAHLLADAPVTACVDFAVAYASARGAARLKVFKGTTVALQPGVPGAIRFRRDFVPRTTRVLYPGPHAVQVRVNGITLAELPFTLTG